MTAKSRFREDKGCLVTMPVLRWMVTFSTMAWTRSILSRVCSTERMLGATRVMVLASSSSQALMAWMRLNPGTSNHLVHVSM